MDHPVEIVAFHRGERQTGRGLSQVREQRAAWAAAGIAGAVAVGAMSLFALLTWASGFVLHGPTFVASWAAVTAFVTAKAYGHARRRASRYRIGARMDADAFASMDIDLVRRREDGRGYELAVARGMRGILDEGGVRRPLEALVHGHAVAFVPLAQGTTAHVEFGHTTFVVRCFGAGEAPPPDELSTPLPRPLQLPGLGAKRFARSAGFVTPVAAALCLFSAVPATAALTDADMKSIIPSTSSPWETEKALRVQAQRQAAQLHACFDPLPLACQKPGYVGIGLKLAVTGEVRGHWIARSTYRDDRCPVTDCMAGVVAGWFFDRIPEPMSLVVPVQVLQTRTPHSFELRVPVKLAEAGENSSKWP
jgi:hypothetical protein